jgi:hypothetical protein
VTGRAVGEQLEPLVVSPKTACKLLSIGNTRFYQLRAAGELETYHDGRMLRVTMRSIRARIARLLAGEGATGAATEAAPPRHRGRPRKNANAAVMP